MGSEKRRERGKGNLEGMEMMETMERDKFWQQLELNQNLEIIQR
jgi:hypothetical protein